MLPKAYRADEQSLELTVLPYTVSIRARASLLNASSCFS